MIWLLKLLKDNPLLRALVVCAVGAVSYLSWLFLVHDKKIERKALARIERKADEQVRKADRVRDASRAASAAPGARIGGVRDPYHRRP